MAVNQRPAVLDWERPSECEARPLAVDVTQCMRQCYADAEQLHRAGLHGALEPLLGPRAGAGTTMAVTPAVARVREPLAAAAKLP